MESGSVLINYVLLLFVISLFILTYHIYIRPRFVSSLRFLPSPTKQSLVWGHSFSKESLDWDIDSCEELGYPGVFKYSGPFGSEGVIVSDVTTLSHILIHNPYEFVRPAGVQRFIAQALGSGLVAAVGDTHKRQRRVMSAAFGNDTINKLLPVFYETTLQLGQNWRQNQQVASDKNKFKTVDMLQELNRVTLDAIGLGCFGYDFKSLSEKPSVLATALNYATENIGKDVSSTGKQFMEIFTESIPSMLHLPTKSSIYRKIFFNIVNKETSAIIEEKRSNDEKREAKDIISVIMASMDRNKFSNNYLTDDEIKGQMVTFVLAGQQNTSLILTWLLYYLALNKQVQERLRKELWDHGFHDSLNSSESLPDIDTLLSLPYLDAVCNETLRLEPPVDVTLRSPVNDCTLPLSSPLTLENGDKVDSICLPKDTILSISPSIINKSKRIWGCDAKIFRPERFLDFKNENYNGIKDNVFKATKGLATKPPLFTFLGGTRSCIGYRFALLEIKAIAAVLVANFEFEPPQENYAENVIRKRSILARPFLKDDPSLVPKLPLNFRPL